MEKNKKTSSHKDYGVMLENLSAELREHLSVSNLKELKDLFKNIRGGNE
jgi:hypothetical protein